jgi:glycine betaine catabolism A
MSTRTPHRAPFDPALLEPVTRPLGRSRTLPGEAYTSETVLAWEREHFFEGSWVCAGGATTLANAGDQAAVRAGEEGVLLARGDDGALRGFFNVCRHRGHELLPCGAGGVNRRAIRCPYHAWVYGLDGTLRSNPKFDELDADDPVHDGLVPVRVEEWHGWVFVNASGDAPPLPEHLGPTLEHLLARYRPEDLLPAATHTYEVAANWKSIVENYHECYHCTQIHPELCKVTPPDSGENYEPDGAWAGGSMELMDHAETMSLTGRSGSEPLAGLTDGQRRYVHYIGLFPNLLVSAHPDYVMTHRLEALAPDRTFVECEWLFPPSALAGPGFDPTYAVDFWDLTNRQDWAACESVQRGLASRGYRQGPLSSAEGAVHQFMCIVANGYQSGVVAAPRTREPAG